MNRLFYYLEINQRLEELTKKQSELLNTLDKTKTQIKHKIDEIADIQTEIDWTNKNYDDLCKLYSESEIDGKLYQLTVTKFDLMEIQYDYTETLNVYLAKAAEISSKILDLKMKLLELDREAYFRE